MSSKYLNKVARFNEIV